MNNILSPQIKSKELMLNPDFQTFIIDKNYAKIQTCVQNLLRECYLDLAYSILDGLEKDLRHNKTIDKNSIKQMRDSLNIVKYFNP